MTLRTWTKKDVTKGTRVLLRVDLNIAMGEVSPKHPRVLAACDEARRLCKRGARVALLTHVGEPHGEHDVHLSTKFLLPLLNKLLDQQIGFEKNCVGPEVQRAVGELNPGQCLLLENVRFHSREEENAIGFAQQLAQGFDVYVNNAFGVCHRAQASVQAIATLLPSFAGSALVAEVKELSKPLTSPLLLALGGVKLTTKLPLLEHLGPRADHILLGGGIAITFAVAAGIPLPVQPDAQFCQPADVAVARRFFERYHHKISLPIDLVVERSSRRIVDVGGQTHDLFRTWALGAKTVVWNGCLGVVERESGRAGTAAFADALYGLRRARVIVGGGDTAAFVGTQVSARTFVSTGGGAMLAFLAGQRLPGLEVLRKS